MPSSVGYADLHQRDAPARDMPSSQRRAYPNRQHGGRIGGAITSQRSTSPKRPASPSRCIRARRRRRRHRKCSERPRPQTAAALAGSPDRTSARLRPLDPQTRRPPPPPMPRYRVFCLTYPPTPTPFPSLIAPWNHSRIVPSVSPARIPPTKIRRRPAARSPVASLAAASHASRSSAGRRRASRRCRSAQWSARSKSRCAPQRAKGASAAE